MFPPKQEAKDDLQCHQTCHRHLCQARFQSGYFSHGQGVWMLTFWPDEPWDCIQYHSKWWAQSYHWEDYSYNQRWSEIHICYDDIQAHPCTDVDRPCLSHHLLEEHLSPSRLCQQSHVSPHCSNRYAHWSPTPLSVGVWYIPPNSWGLRQLPTGTHCRCHRPQTNGKCSGRLVFHVFGLWSTPTLLPVDQPPHACLLKLSSESTKWLIGINHNVRFHSSIEMDSLLLHPSPIKTTLRLQEWMITRNYSQLFTQRGIIPTVHRLFSHLNAIYGVDDATLESAVMTQYNVEKGL